MLQCRVFVHSKQSQTAQATVLLAVWMSFYSMHKPKIQDSNKTWILKNSFLKKFHSRVRCLKLIFFQSSCMKFVCTVRMEFQWCLRNCERENDEYLRWCQIFYINRRASTFLRLPALRASGNFSLSANTGQYYVS